MLNMKRRKDTIPEILEQPEKLKNDYERNEKKVDTEIADLGIEINPYINDTTAIEEDIQINVPL